MYTDFRVYSWKLKYEKMNCRSPKGWVFALSIQRFPRSGSSSRPAPPAPLCSGSAPGCPGGGSACHAPNGDRGGGPAPPGPPVAYPARAPAPGSGAKPMGAGHAPPGAGIWRSARRPRALSRTALRTCGTAPGPSRRLAMASPATGEVVIIGR